MGPQEAGGLAWAVRPTEGRGPYRSNHKKVVRTKTRKLKYAKKSWDGAEKGTNLRDNASTARFTHGPATPGLSRKKDLAVQDWGLTGRAWQKSARF